MKRTTFAILTIALVIILAGCSTPQESEPLLSSEDFTYNTAMINRYEDDAFEINLVSWEFVTSDMVRIIGERRSEIGDKIHITNYDFLIDKSNVTFYTIEREEN